MRADARNRALVEDDDAVGIADRADALGNDELRRLAAGLAQALAQNAVGAEVQRREGIVKNQNFRLATDRAGDREPLLLAAGEIRAALRDVAIRSVRLLADKFRRLRDGNPLKSTAFCATWPMRSCSASSV